MGRFESDLERIKALAAKEQIIHKKMAYKWRNSIKGFTYIR